MFKALLVSSLFFASFLVADNSWAQQTPATGYVPGGGIVTPSGGSGQNPANGYVPGGGITTTAPTTSPRPQARPTTGGAAPAASPAQAAQQTQQEITKAIQAYVVPTSTRNFSLGNLNSDNEASLIISSGNEENNVIFRVIRLIAMLIGTVAILLYIIAGYFMIFSQGDENQLTKGKQILTFTSLGLVLAFGAYMIVQLVMGLIYFTS
jgi:hypothetical protein